MGTTLNGTHTGFFCEAVSMPPPIAELKMPNLTQNKDNSQLDTQQETTSALFEFRLSTLDFYRQILGCPHAAAALLTLLTRFERLEETNPWKAFSGSKQGASALLQRELYVLARRRTFVIQCYQQERLLADQIPSNDKATGHNNQTQDLQFLIKPRHYQKLLRLLGQEGAELQSSIDQDKLALTTKLAEHYKPQLSELIEQTKLAHPGIDHQEIKQLVYLSLVACAGAFEPERGTHFISFLRTAFKRDLVRAQNTNRQLIDIPHKTRSQFFSLYHGARQEHQVENPSAEQLASFAGISLRRAVHIERLVERMQISLQASYSNGGRSDYNPADIPDPSEDTNALIRVQRREAYINLQLAFSALRGTHPKISYIIERHFGLDAKKPCSLKELALEFAVSIARIHELEKQGLKLLRSNRHIKNLGDD